MSGSFLVSVIHLLYFTYSISFQLNSVGTKNVK